MRPLAVLPLLLACALPTAAAPAWPLGASGSPLERGRDPGLARAPDGSFQPRPGHESPSMGSNGDATSGEAWTTAAWAIVLGCQRQKGGRLGLPYWMGLARAERPQR